MKNKVLKFDEFLNEAKFKRNAIATGDEGKIHGKKYKDKNVQFEYWDDSRTVIVDGKFSNGVKIYDTAFDYLESIDKQTDGGDLEVFFVDNKFILVGESGRKTVSIEQLKNFSDSLKDKK